ncbi:putative 3-hydroxyacyl-CoA dehydrogenase, NAD binding domain [Aspergillus clavatus NRRL 1]|uniref:L-gulonate 3-dehydrogenase n=1 Tax=Aspergillus clavatus (strain ATCC 1007 / CBS 513.65 / DSM 816 / NCTC 3887 / NRRL 1 / QM 1276 / 107) TaxID=344612 RepID=A1C6N9_ASPCL|nr:3-hydroxyacyl-CoA dehydrogenase, NAD binding domain, putative [Aspergillus clavatus NRRL 1]EAW14060.1 3-hydroxyacyl-CoA dehydrogenase, NAD binding domain, putative [Aspergillus clavatus NRRL 1]
MAASEPQRIALIGVGTIGMSMAALHLARENTIVSVFDTRPDLEQYLLKTLPNYLSEELPSASSVTSLISSGRLHIHTSLESACASATIIQEQGPENLSFKKSLWAQVESMAPPSAHLWTSTSGIAASAQQSEMRDKTRLLVVHPFNPPHIMPLLEIVPSPDTAPERVEFARQYFSRPGSRHRPVIIKKEIPGFVGNRLAFALLREACYLVQEDVVTAKDLDTILMASLGPRWAGNGVFESYQQGGGEGGISAFLDKLGGTMQEVWDGLGKVDVLGGTETGWKEKVISQTDGAYGTFTAEMIKEKEKRLEDLVRVQEKKYDIPELE